MKPPMTVMSDRNLSLAKNIHRATGGVGGRAKDPRESAGRGPRSATPSCKIRIGKLARQPLRAEEADLYDGSYRAERKVRAP